SAFVSFSFSFSWAAPFGGGVQLQQRGRFVGFLGGPRPVGDNLEKAERPDQARRQALVVDLGPWRRRKHISPASPVATKPPSGSANVQTAASGTRWRKRARAIRDARPGGPEGTEAARCL